jgi:hypothetical protein
MRIGMTRLWMLDELAHAGPEHLDSTFVAGYERKQGYPDPAEDLAVLAAHGLDATSTVVDLAPGRAGSRSPPRAGSVRSRLLTSPRRCWRSCATGPPPPAWRTWRVCRRGS